MPDWDLEFRFSCGGVGALVEDPSAVSFMRAEERLATKNVCPHGQFLQATATCNSSQTKQK